MTREEQLKQCKICLNRGFDITKGTVCKLTNDVATFEEACNKFILDSLAEDKLKN